ncbi:hypothetical protein CK203_002993 [Vitis vinifera]|uniref:Uncharacterized protein n=1 Tax=Vitis vinifera TaxID=29760 RepID=A0A438K784_VITVI|nr:hypothetical protein CK203_002993 [Vitis vinifera]
MVSSAYSDQTNNEKVPPPVKAISTKMEFNRVNCLVWVLHESARSFSHTVESFELARSGPELAMAWVGVDVHAWHKRIAHQVAVYALLRTAIELEFFLSHGRCNNPSLVREIFDVSSSLQRQTVIATLYARTNILFLHFIQLVPNNKLGRANIESQLKTRHPKLVEWFRMVELPRIAGFFIPLLKKWSMEYAGRDYSGYKLRVAVGKLGSGHISCPLFISSIEDALIELMNLSHSLVSVDKLHQLATEAGMGIKDLDEQVKDFLSYLECGSLFIYPKFSSLSVYQLFMEQFNSAALKCRLVGILAPKSLLTSCLEDYWAAYDRSGTTSSSLTLEAQQKASCKVGTETRTLVEAGRTAESEALHQNLLRKSSMKLISTSSDIWMGTQLLFIDIMASLELLLKQMRGRRITERERKKLKQTLADIASLIPVTILMLLPVSVVGHAAILAAIKKYMPSLIPSPYSSERLDVVKQLKRSKKMEVQTPSNQEDASSAISKING